MKLEEYLEYCWKTASDYIKGVEDGSIKTNKWIKLAIDRHVKDIANVELYDYRMDKIEQVFKFFYFLKINVKDTFIQYKLIGYQAFIIVALFGLYIKGTKKRKYRYAFLFVARKNNKTTFAAALQLYFILADGVEAPQSLLVSNSRENAGIALEAATNIINNSPLINKRLEAQRYKIIHKDRSKAGFCKTLAANANKLDGYSANAAILDEIHSYPNDSLFNVIKSSILARENPMILLISSAGFNLDSFCFDLVETGKNTLNEMIENPSFFFLLYMMEDGDDLTDNTNWVKSNPALNEVFDIDVLITEYQQAEYLPSQMNSFLTKHLNIFVEQEDIWIPDDNVKGVMVDMNMEKYLGKECFIGMDLSSTRDLTAVTVLFFDDELQKFVAFPHFFMPNNPAKFLRKGGYNIDVWVKGGYICKSTTKTTDYNAIFDLIKKISNDYNIVKVMYDKWNSANLINRIQTDLEFAYCEPFDQTAIKFNQPLKQMENLIYNEEIIFQNNPVVRWNFRNAVLYRDGNNNIKILKNKSLDSVDFVVSLAMAYGGYLEYYTPVYK